MTKADLIQDLNATTAVDTDKVFYELSSGTLVEVVGVRYEGQEEFIEPPAPTTPARIILS